MTKKVLVTRAAGQQAEEFANLLEAEGFEPLILSVIEFTPPEDKMPLLEATDNLSTYDWLMLTSTNSVKYFIKSIEESGRSLSDLERLKICAVGPKTAEAAKEAGLKIDIIPETFQAEGVLKALEGIGIKGKRVLFPRAEKGRELLPQGLIDMGADVTLVPVYRTVKPEGKSEELRAILKDGLDVITFTSGSTVSNFMAILGEENRTLLQGIKIACISEITAETAEKYGIETDILPEENTTCSLAKAIKDRLI